MTFGRRAASALALTALVGLALGLGWAWLAGWRLNVVESGSMAPLLHRNSLAIVVPAHGPHVDEGDVIAFADQSRGGVEVMHRVTEVIEQNGGRFYETRGDANAVPDAWLVPASEVRGRLVFQLAHVGGLVRGLAFPRGALVLVGVPLLALVAGEVGDRRRRVLGRVCPTCGAASIRTAGARRRVPVGWPTLSFVQVPEVTASRPRSPHP